MTRTFCWMLLQVVCNSLSAQIIGGRVLDSKGTPLSGTSLYLKGTYDGTISGADGTFQFPTGQTGHQLLVASFIGYVPFDTTLNLRKGQKISINIVLKEKNTEMNDVVITAGVFEAGDKKRGIQLTALDMLTTANSNGDFVGALNTLPGTQMVGEEGALFVRGGEKNETKVFVDGMLVSDPYSSKVPDIPSRGRFSPMLFSGVSFSSGGYSAEYGQALSSVLILQTPSFPKKSLTSASLFPFGAGINKTWKGDSVSLTCSMDYYNFYGYDKIVKQNADWTKSPENLLGNLMFRKRIGKSGFLKSFAQIGLNRLGLTLPDYLAEIDLAKKENVDLDMTNNDIYLNSVYTMQLSSPLSLRTGISYNYDDELINFEHFSVNTYNRALQYRFALQDEVNDNIRIKAGGEFNYQHYRQNYIEKDTSLEANPKFNSPLSAAFIEAEWKVGTRLFSRIGTRLEYSGLNKETDLVPRLSLAYKTGEFSQVSLAYGIFTELPLDDYVKFKPALSSEMATHYIANYQITKNNRMFRIEGYTKQYLRLVRDSALNDPDPAHYNNSGYGYARGVELFVRDRQTFSLGDFWISYTYLDTKKLYQNLTSCMQPYLFSKHSLNFTGKYFISRLSTQAGFTYQFASSRPCYYLNPQNGEIITYHTPDYNNLSVNLSYLTKLWGYFTVIHFSVSNVPGFNQVFSYHFSQFTNASGMPDAYAVKPQAKRFFVVGLFITFDKYSSSFNN